MSTKKPLLILIDGYGLIFRAYYTIRNMTYRGKATNALYGFTNMVLKLIDSEPDAMLIALDWHGKTVRKEQYEQYKANRDEAPDDLKQQMAELRVLVKQMGLNWLEAEKYEADDVIGTLALKGKDEGYRVAIVSGDHDLCQIVGDDIEVWYTTKGTSEFKKYDPNEVKERFGVTPEHLTDYKALVGDASDNIPGVKGIGKVTAKKLLSEYKDIDEIYDNIDKIKPDGLRKKLEVNKSNAYLSKELALIKTDLDIELPQESKSYFDPEGALSVFKKLGFKSFISRLNLEDKLDANELEITPSEKLDKWTVIQSMDELDEIIDILEKKGEFAFDVETSSLDARRTNLVGIAIAVSSDEGWYIPLGHTDSGDLLAIMESKYQNLSLSDVIEKLRPIFTSDKVKKIAQNAKFEMLTMWNQGVDVRNFGFDTMIASYVLNPDERHNLKELGLKWLDREMVPISDLIGSGKNQKSMSDLPIESVAPYAVDDATVTWELAELFEKKLKEIPKIERLFYNIELPLVTVLAEMEQEGLKVDINILKEISQSLEKDIENITAETHSMLGKSVNLNSPKQLQELLFKELNLTNPAKGSTNIEALEEIKDEHPIVPLIIEHRSLVKIKSTYADGLLNMVDSKDSRIHTSFNQTMTTTGRLSSSEPNLQNIPIRTEKGRLIRKAFIPNNDNEMLMAADYSQIELRLLAHYSGDEVLIEAFKSGEDIHTKTAKEVLNLKDDEVTPDDRRMAKVVNFGIIYGMGAFSLSKDLGISKQEAQTYIDEYFARYPKVRKFFDELLSTARENGFVETFMGRRRYFSDLNSSNSQKKAMSERAAINMPLQGGAADIMKKAMVETRDTLLKNNLKSKIILQVHDEIVLSVKESEFEDVRKIADKTLSKTFELKVPLVVNFKTGKNWHDMEDLSD